DPLDGTKSFVRGTSFYSTQIALMHQGQLLLGVSAAPQLGETMWARRGGGAWLNGQRVRVADTSDMSQMTLSLGNVRAWAAATSRWLALGDLGGRVDRLRGYGDCGQYHRLACGALDAVVESDVNILDVAALAVIVREAGGVFTDLDGREPDLDTSSVLAALPALHEAVRHGLRGGAKN